METINLIVQAFVTAYLAGWMTFGVKDNIQHPSLNRTLTTMVLQMDRLVKRIPTTSGSSRTAASLTRLCTATYFD